MSRILRRPMFRGGPVDSRGTGITSGLMDGGRVGFDNGGSLTLGKDINQSLVPLNFNDLANTKFSVGMPIPIEGAATTSIEEQVEE